MAWIVWLSAVGLLIGAAMGLYAMINPRWAARLVRLRDDPERPGGFAEFRGTYGGLFFATHAVGLVLLVMFLNHPGFGEWPQALGFVWGALSVCAAIWWGTAIGRVISIAADRTGGGFNYGSVAFEIALGALVAAPVLSVAVR